MYKPASKDLQCPSCLTTHQFNRAEDLMKLIKNFTLLSLVENAKSTPNPSLTKGSKGNLHKSKTLLIGEQMQRQGGAFDRDLDDMEECKSEEEECMD